jgi:hypothetical protein
VGAGQFEVAKGHQPSAISRQPEEEYKKGAELMADLAGGLSGR